MHVHTHLYRKRQKMAKVRMTIELEYDADIMHCGAKEWFFGEVLGADSGLTLFSDEIGDFVGTVQVINATEVADGHGDT